MDFLSKENILASARKFSFSSKNNKCTVLHLAHSLVHENDSLLMLALRTLGEEALNNVVSCMSKEILEYKRVKMGDVNEVVLSTEVTKLINNSEVSLQSLLVSLVDSSQMRKVLSLAGVDRYKLISQIRSLCDFALDLYCQPIGTPGGKIERAVEREKEVKHIINTLVQNTSKKNALLIGEKWGVNRMLEGVLYQISSGNAGGLDGTKVLALNIQSIMATTNSPKEFSLKLKKVLTAAEESKHKLVLFIDQIHLLFMRNSLSSSKELMLNFFSSGKVTCIGATTNKDYHTVVQANADLDDFFTKIFVPDTSQKDSVVILKGMKQKLVETYNIQIPNDIFEYTVKLSHRYAGGKLPTNAINLLDRACAMVRQQFSGEVDEIAGLRIEIISLENMISSLDDLEETRGPELMEMLSGKRTQLDLLEKKCKQEKDKVSQIQAIKYLKKITDQLTDTHNMDPDNDAKRAKILKGYADEIPKLESGLSGEVTLTVGKEHIARALSELTGIPSSTFGQDAIQKLETLRDWLNSQVIGQEEAATAVYEIVKRTLDEDNTKPGSLLFTGTTGVGKTQMAKALTEHLFGDQSCMIRFDMNEFSQPNTVTRFFGPPPGYQGHDEGGQLTQAVRKKPHCVILLDEFDKAHKQIHSSLLHVLDEGRMSDCHGPVDFKNTVIIMTSNVGAEHLKKGSIAGASDKVIDEVKKKFSHELIARVGELVVFNPLIPELVEKIIVHEIEKRKAEFVTRGAVLEVTREAERHIVEQGLKVASGVRAIKAWIEKHVDHVLKDYILQGYTDKTTSMVVSLNSTRNRLSFFRAG